MLKDNVCQWLRQKINDKKVIGFHLGVVFFTPCISNLYMLDNEKTKIQSQNVYQDQ